MARYVSLNLCSQYDTNRSKGSIFYFGYLVGQPPAGYFLQRLPIAKFLGFCTLGWGLVLMTTPACKSFAGTAANRFLLGLLESSVNPGFVLITSM